MLDVINTFHHLLKTFLRNVILTLGVKTKRYKRQEHKTFIPITDVLCL